MASSTNGLVSEAENWPGLARLFLRDVDLVAVDAKALVDVEVLQVRLNAVHTCSAG